MVVALDVSQPEILLSKSEQAVPQLLPPNKPYMACTSFTHQSFIKPPYCSSVAHRALGSSLHNGSVAYCLIAVLRSLPLAANAYVPQAPGRTPCNFRWTEFGFEEVSLGLDGDIRRRRVEGLDNAKLEVYIAQ